MSYSLPINANSRITFLFVKDNVGNWVPAQSGDIGADKWALKITGYNRASGNKDFSNNVTVGGTFRASGAANFTANVSAGGLTVAGNTQINTLSVFGSANFEDYASFYNDVQVNGNLSVDSSTALNGELSVGGQAQFYSSAYFQYGLSVSAQADFYAAANFYQTLQIYGSSFDSYSALPRFEGDNRWGPFRIYSSAATTISVDASMVNQEVRTTANTPVTITVFGDSSGAWEANAEVVFAQGGNGQITIVAGAGVTINSSETLKSAKKFAYMALKRISANVFDLTGERELL